MIEPLMYTRDTSTLGAQRERVRASLVRANLEVAAMWCGKAAAQGDAAAQYNLSSYYHDGTGVEKNLEISAMWCGKAAAQGVARAQHNLSIYYLKGTGVDKNFEIAAMWCGKAAAQGLALA